MTPDMGIVALLGLLMEAQSLKAGPAKAPQGGPPGPPAGAPGTPPVAAPSTAPATSSAPAASTAKAPPAGSPSTAQAAATAAPGTAPPLPPWPTAVPATLPPFPGPGWVPDTSGATAVNARANYWNPFLWDQPNKKIRKAFVQEQLGGQWMTFAAAWHPGDQGAQTFMATEAWKLAAAPSLSAPPAALTPVQATAQAMNNALASHGYKLADQMLYKAFEQAAGLTADGFPGTATMTALKNTLQPMGTSIAPVKVYPWKSTGAYDGKNAPTAAEWHGSAGTAPAGHHATAPPAAAAPAPAGKPAPVNPYPGPGAWQSNTAYVARYQAALSWLSNAFVEPTWNPQGVDGQFGPNTQAAVKAFQAAHNLSPVDGEAGQATANAIDSLVAAADATPTPAAA